MLEYKCMFLNTKLVLEHDIFVLVHKMLEYELFIIEQ